MGISDELLPMLGTIMEIEVRIEKLSKYFPASDDSKSPFLTLNW